MSECNSGDFRLGPWLIEPSRNLVSRNDHDIQIEPKIMAVLVLLARNQGQTLSREAFFQSIWPDLAVTDMSLTRCISELRRIFEDNPRNPIYIQTVHKIGYRLLPEVTYLAEPEPSDLSESKLKNGPFKHLRALPGRAGIGLSLLTIGVVLLGQSSLWWSEEKDEALINSRPFEAKLEIEFGAPREVSHFPWVSHPAWDMQPSLDRHSGRMAFVSDREKTGHTSLYILERGATEPRRLGGTAGVVNNPVWSPDGTQIAFQQLDPDGCQVSTLDINSGKVETLMPCSHFGDSKLAWSPDGTWLAISDRGRGDDAFALFRFNFATRSLQTLSKPPDGFYGDLRPRFSPDGKEILFFRGETEGTGHALEPASGNLYLISTETLQERKLTRLNQVIYGHNWHVQEGGVIYAARNSKNRRWELRSLSIDDGRERVLFHSPVPVCNPVMMDSRRILYESWRSESDLHQLNFAKGTGEALVDLNSTLWDGCPSLGPESRHLVFSSLRSGQNGLWMAELNGDNLRKVAEPNCFRLRNAALSHGEQLLAFECHSSKQSAVKVIAVDGVHAGATVLEIPDAMSPSWSLDDRWLYFGALRDQQWQIWKIAVGSANAPIMVTRHGGIRAFETRESKSRVLFVSKLGQPGVFRLDLSTGEEEKLQIDTLQQDWANWCVRGDSIYFPARVSHENIFLMKYSITGGTTSRVAIMENVIPLGRSSMTVSPDEAFLVFEMESRPSADIVMALLSTGESP